MEIISFTVKEKNSNHPLGVVKTVEPCDKITFKHEILKSWKFYKFKTYLKPRNIQDLISLHNKRSKIKIELCHQ